MTNKVPSKLEVAVAAEAGAPSSVDHVCVTQQRVDKILARLRAERATRQARQSASSSGA